MTENESQEISRFEQKPLRRVLISLPRSGTHWLKHMISAALGVDPLDERIEEPERLKEVLEKEAQERLVYEHFQFHLHSKILDPAAYPDLRMILLHRHPLDQHISAMTKNAYDGILLPDPNAGPLEYAKFLILGLYDEILGRKFSVDFFEDQKTRVMDWLESGCCLDVKYEDLVADTRQQLERCLQHLEIQYEESDIPRIVEQHRFEVLSGGRKPGEVEETSHYRKGVPGEWRTVFTAEEIEKIRETCGECITRSGYEIS